MKNLLALLLVLSVGIGATSAFADDPQEINGTIQGDFPRSVEVLAADGSHQSYNYSPLGGDKNYVSRYITAKAEYLKVSGEMSSMCMNHILGTLVHEIDINFLEDNKTEASVLKIPADTQVASTCSDGSNEAHDLTFILKR